MDIKDKENLNNDYNKIKSIETSVGGYFGGFYEVYIDIENKNLTWKHSLKTHAELYEKTINESELIKLTEELSKL